MMVDSVQVHLSFPAQNLPSWASFETGSSRDCFASLDSFAVDQLASFPVLDKEFADKPPACGSCFEAPVASSSAESSGKCCPFAELGTFPFGWRSSCSSFAVQPLGLGGVERGDFGDIAFALAAVVVEAAAVVAVAQLDKDNQQRYYERWRYFVAVACMVMS